MKKTIFLSLFLSLLIMGCTKPYPQSKVNTPEWILKPSLNNKVGAVGSAQEHFKGKTAQRKLAISRALDELAQQNGVQVTSETKRNEKRNGIYTNSSTEFFTIQKSSGEMLQAHIQEVWIHPKTKEIFVWLLED